jgi:hypothetical protein
VTPSFQQEVAHLPSLGPARANWYKLKRQFAEPLSGGVFAPPQT